MYSEKTMLGPKPSVAVCVACFFGRRQRHWEDKSATNPALSHVLRQMKYLDEYTTKAHRISFVVNRDLGGSPAEADNRRRQKASYEEFCKIVEAKNASDPKRVWEVLPRPNLNISYGAWKWYLEGVCSDIDYVYLLEDDYSPAFKGYDAEVIDRVFSSPEARETIVKACSLYVDDTLSEHDRSQGSRDVRVGLPHAAVSNGVVNMRVYREVPEGFFMHDTVCGFSNKIHLRSREIRRKKLVHLQRTYLSSYTQHPSGKYRAFNLGQYYSVPFIETKNCKQMTFGAAEGPVLFSPTELLDL